MQGGQWYLDSCLEGYMDSSGKYETSFKQPRPDYSKQGRGFDSPMFENWDGELVLDIYGLDDATHILAIALISGMEDHVA